MTTSTVTVEDLLDNLCFHARSEREKGDLFERLVRRFLLTEPLYADRFDEVWMWSDWPGRKGRSDTGIDLVAHERDGGLCAIQCKFFDPEHAITKPDVDSFLAASGAVEFDSRLFVSTTEKWNRNAEAALHGQRVPVNRIGLTDLIESTIDWSTFDFSTPDAMERKGRKVARPYQRAAIDAVLEGFTTRDRGKLIMACGTGKTFTSLRLAEQVAGAGGRVLFLVPSIALLSQTLREWVNESEMGITPFAVCSDGKVGKAKGGEGEDISVVDLQMPATTNPVALARGLASARVNAADTMTVVFSTYQSIDVVHQAQDQRLLDLESPESVAGGC